MLRLPKSERRDIYGYVYHVTNVPKHGKVWKNQCFHLKEVLPRNAWVKAPTWECLFVQCEGLFLSVYNAHRNLFKRYPALLELFNRFEFEFCRRGNDFFFFEFAAFSEFIHTPCGFTFTQVLWRLYTHVLMSRQMQTHSRKKRERDRKRDNTTTSRHLQTHTDAHHRQTHTNNTHSRNITFSFQLRLCS